jgi:hypothetical protein
MGRSYQRQRGAKQYRHKPGRILVRTVGPFVALAAFAVFNVTGGWLQALTSTSGGVSLDSLGAMAPGSGCNVKGNISLNTGERIYHVPGQKYYNETRISPQHGERWFCSEAEARRAGWRRSRV